MTRQDMNHMEHGFMKMEHQIGLVKLQNALYREENIPLGMIMTF